MATITISLTGTQIAVMHDNNKDLYATPGFLEHPYWDTQANFQDDVLVATTWNVLERIGAEAGYGVDIDDLREDETVYEVSFEM